MKKARSGRMSRRLLLQTGAAALAGGWMPERVWSASPPPNRFAVESVENCWIPTRDGTLLACRVWIPKGVPGGLVGVVLEANPYSKRDGTRAADDWWGQNFCPHGFAYARLDLRGTGESGGLLSDEYLQQEQQDIIDAIAFLAKAPWCNGAVGMRGYSWGGFNALQVAALNPPQLKAIITACSSDDRYRHDAHFMGGVPLSSGIQWAALFRNVMGDAPDPAIVGDRWRQMWLDRLRATPAIAHQWLSHRMKDQYWKQASVSQDYGAIRCGVYAVGGQADAYCGTVLRLLERLQAPRIGMIGPWGHQFPVGAAPGPGVDWVHEEVRWWSHWLHGQDTGIMKEPMLRAYVNHETPAEAWPRDISGQWVSVEHWPPPAGSEVIWHLDRDGLGLAKEPGDGGRDQPCRIDPHQTIGLNRQAWLPLDPAKELPGDQSRDDRLCLIFDSPPLAEAYEVFGAGRADVTVAADRPSAKIIIRVNEVLADGISRPLCYGVFNLRRRGGDDRDLPLLPGQFYEVSVPLTYVAHRIRPGSRIRVAISESLWPLTAPSPEPVTLSLLARQSRLVLPTRGPIHVGGAPVLRNESGRRRSPGALQGNDAVHAGQDSGVRQVGKRFEITHKMTTTDRFEQIALERSVESNVELRINDDDPNMSAWKYSVKAGSQRADWQVETVTSVELTLKDGLYSVCEKTEASENGVIVFQTKAENIIVGG